MASDLEASLVDGGISAAAAKILSNAIANAATGRLSLSRQLEDGTPTRQMRMIDSNARRYLLTNLDQPADNPFRERVNSNPGRPTPPGRSHPYENSQPAAANPTVATPGVQGGKYVTAEPRTTNEVAQSEVTLNTDNHGGQHARLNEATGKVESVPISVEVEPKGIIEASVAEEQGQTVIRIRIVNDALLEFIDWKWGRTTAITTPSGAGVLYVENVALQPYGAQVLIPR